MQVNRLEEVFTSLGMAARGKTCEGMKGNFYNSLMMTIPATIISTPVHTAIGSVVIRDDVTRAEIARALRVMAGREALLA